MTVAFPDTTIQIVQPETIIGNQPQRVLLVGQLISGGTATPGALIENIGNSGEEDGLFTSYSMIAGMIKAFKKTNTTTRLDAIGLSDDPAGVAATATITFTGPATADGSYKVMIGSAEFSFNITVLSGNSATTIAAALVAAINANPNVPVSAANVAGVVTLTASNKGVEGNYIGIRGSGSATGTTMAIVGFAGGATNPSLTTVFDSITDKRYQTIVFPSSYNRAVLRDFLDDRWNVSNDILDGVGVMVIADTFSNFKTLLVSENSQSMIYFLNRPRTGTNRKDFDIFELPNKVAASFAAKRSLRLTAGADLTGIVVADGIADKTGGMELASLPYANTPMTDLPLVATSELLLRSEIVELNDAGGSVMSNNIANTNLVLGQAITPYKTNAAGNADITFKYLNYVDTISNVREFFHVRLRNKFNQYRLTDGDLAQFRSIANEASIAAFLDSIYQELADRMLVIKGPDGLRYFKDNRTISIDKPTGTVNIFAKVPIVVQLRKIVFVMQLSFDDTSAQG